MRYPLRYLIWAPLIVAVVIVLLPIAGRWLEPADPIEVYHSSGLPAEPLTPAQRQAADDRFHAHHRALQAQLQADQVTREINIQHWEGMIREMEILAADQAVDDAQGRR